MEQPNIFEFVDYRQFLEAYLAYKKYENKGYSQRVLLRHMGISSSGFITNVLKGRNHLTHEQVLLVSKIMRLTQKEERYFSTILSFSKAKSVSEKNMYYQKILDMRKTKIPTLDPSQDSLFRKWYFVVVKVLVDMMDIYTDYTVLAKSVVPTITYKEAEEAVELLLGLQLISRDETGKLSSINNTLSTGSAVTSHFLAHHQMSMIDLGKSAIERIPSHKRDISGLTISLSEHSHTLVMEEIRLFRQRLLQIAEDERIPDRVVRCNFQVFPVAELESVL